MTKAPSSPRPEPLEMVAPPPPERPSGLAWRRFRRHKPAVISAGYLIFLVGFLVIWPWVSGESATALSDRQFEPPSLRHWCGTDVHGRDLLTRMVLGGRISLLVGLVGAGVSLVIGVGWGAVAGYRGGRWDNLMMRFVDILYALPAIVFVIVLITTLEVYLRGFLERLGGALGMEEAVLGAGTRLLFLFAGLGAVSWLTMARIVRGQVLSLKNRPFVDASRALGAGTWHVLRRHILPNITGVVMVYLTLTIPSIVLYESFLSYLGLGIQPPMASWGSLIAEGAEQLNPIRIYWWLLVFPAGLLVFTLLALNFFGDGLKDALDPRAK